MRLKRENWNHKYYWVIRNKKGQLISKTKYKKSLSKEKAEERFKKQNTLSKNIYKVKSTKERIKINESDFIKSVEIGKKARILQSKSRFESQNFYQVVAVIDWGNKETTTGYSNIKGSKKQAFNRARADAITQGIIKYDYVQTKVDKTTGFFTSPSGRTIVAYQVEYIYQAYVGTKKQLNTIAN
jgi:hypothetical protein